VMSPELDRLELAVEGRVACLAGEAGAEAAGADGAGTDELRIDEFAAGFAARTAGIRPDGSGRVDGRSVGGLVLDELVEDGVALLVEVFEAGLVKLDALLVGIDGL